MNELQDVVERYVERGTARGAAEILEAARASLDDHVATDTTPPGEPHDYGVLRSSPAEGRDETPGASANQLADHLERAASTIEAPNPSPRSTQPAPRRTYRAPVVVSVAATAAILLVAFVAIGRPDDQADLRVAPASTSPTTADASPPMPASTWNVTIDPASGYLPTAAMNLTTDPETGTNTPPGYRDGVLYTQHWSGAYYDTVDPLAGPLLFIDTDFSPPDGSPGALFHRSPSFSIGTAHGAVPAWDEPLPNGMVQFGFRGDDEHLVTVKALGMSRENAIAAVHDLSIGANGRAQMSTPTGLTAHDSDAPRNEGTMATYGKGSDGSRMAPEVNVFVSHRADGPWLLQTAVSFFAPRYGSTTNLDLRRVTVHGRSALLRQVGDYMSVLVMYEPERQRTIELTITGDVGADELLNLAGQLRNVDDSDWQVLVDRCHVPTPGQGC